MQYKNKKLKQIILGIPTLLEPHEMEMVADDDYVLALQSKLLEIRITYQIRISLQIMNLLSVDIPISLSFVS